ncbi:TRAP transporter small permease [Blastochloris sulfoviridis]|uniref:TRAP transporter small permease n=1 Tax=Blastochloris sulfoviridis TaxID=50712 RepID=UPI001478DCEE|nr:TRAP transporter small permease [Blastochloris sulfoviridis]
MRNAAAARGRPTEVRISIGLALGGGAALVALSALVTLSVLLRWLGEGGIPGDFETVEMLTALAAFAMLPLCQQTRGNVIVDTLSRNWPPRAVRLVDALWDVLYAAVALIIAWGAWQGGRDALANGTATMVLGLPVGWAMIAAAGLAVWLAIGAVVSALRLVFEGRS